MVKDEAHMSPVALGFLPHDLQPSGGIQTFVDLFCGIGGFHYAAEVLGLRCVFANDIDEHAARQYEYCHGITPAGDIRKVSVHDIPTHDILFAGFPCQPFSIIGKLKGMDDTRGTLFYEIVRILRHHRPPALVLENVKQLATHDGGTTLKKMLTALEHLGYKVDYKILNALSFGLPQKRERLIIVGLLDGLHNYEWPKEHAEYTPLSELLERKVHSKHYVSDRIKRSRLSCHTSKYKPGIWHENKGGNVSSHPYSCALRAGASYNYLLVDGERRLTPRELLRLQGFPERFEIVVTDNELRKQAGNAVPVPLVRKVINQVLHAASKNKRQSEANQRAVSA